MTTDSIKKKGSHYVKSEWHDSNEAIPIGKHIILIFQSFFFSHSYMQSSFHEINKNFSSLMSQVQVYQMK